MLLLKMNRKDSTYFLVIDGYGDVSNNGQIARSYGVRPVIFLKSGLTFTSGDGTAQNPYTFE